MDTSRSRAIKVKMIRKQCACSDVESLTFSVTVPPGCKCYGLNGTFTVFNQYNYCSWTNVLHTASVHFHESSNYWFIMLQDSKFKTVLTFRLPFNGFTETSTGENVCLIDGMPCSCILNPR